MSDPTSAPLSPAADAAQAPTYRPLSLLALIGVAVAGLYAAVVIIGGLVAFFAGDPWLMAGWTILLPIAGAVLSGMGWWQIQRSEGTLAGDKLARWGLLLSLLVGLGYWSYVGATYFAIGREADQYGQKFVEKLAKRDVLSAFLMVLPPSERPAEGEGARGQVEARFNAGQRSRTGGGGFTAFSQTPYVRLLSLGGPDETKIEFSGVDKWGYLNGGYQVRLLYNIETPQITFVMEVPVQAREGKGSAGRQWFVLWDQIGLRGNLDSKLSPKGKNQLPTAMQGREFLEGPWVRALDGGKTLDAYLPTLPEDQRDAARQTGETTYLGVVLADGLGAGFAPGCAPAAAARLALAADADRGQALFLPGLYDFLRGSLVSAEKDVFWAPDPAARDEIIEEFRQAFRHPNSQLAITVQPDVKVRFPWMHVKDDRFVVECDFMARVPFSAPRYMVEGRVVIDCDAAQAEAGTVSSSGWRILRVELVGAKAAPTMPAAPEGAKPIPPIPAM
jgi:hypothetical protein